MPPLKVAIQKHRTELIHISKQRDEAKSELNLSKQTVCIIMYRSSNNKPTHFTHPHTHPHTHTHTHLHTHTHTHTYTHTHTHTHTHTQQMQIYEDDFRSEREDREKAHSKIAEMETRYVKKVESMTNELQTKARELQVS